MYKNLRDFYPEDYPGKTFLKNCITSSEVINTRENNLDQT